ncbi:hypothetical protein IQ254_23330 [Nodosilinea sp. LEGE 07088]|uniref:hypothetical protein n=1 Tax=Nodosilinea sp. LEGE 07088 TaxID=2777968 RepID=UPI0018824347|nr:hypothetical protein [Nodosilinea sp. LEGE 07088]MBE9140092.1 hypothetical protein [Nodosilinea sp. LEGE 07088]
MTQPSLPQPDPAALKAGSILLALFVALCGLDAALVAMSQDRWAIGRILVTIVVMYFVLQGRKWAKWLLLGLLSLVVVALAALVLFLGSTLSPVLRVGTGLMIGLSVVTAVYLVRSSALQQFFHYQRQMRAVSDL